MGRDYLLEPLEFYLDFFEQKVSDQNNHMLKVVSINASLITRGGGGGRRNSAYYILEWILDKSGY